MKGESAKMVSGWWVGDVRSRRTLDYFSTVPSPLRRDLWRPSLVPAPKGLSTQEKRYSKE